MTIKKPFTPFWLTGWALALALGWLLPNHYAPWTTFHMDVWVAFILLTGAASVFLRCSTRVPWHGITLLVAALVILPLLQYAFGLILISGTAWVNTAYLLGLLIALLTGAQWESSSPDQLANGLFLAIGVAALVSVGLQLHQWFGLDLLGVWSIQVWGDIPFANFVQANQLGTFLLWGLLAIAWGVIRQQIGIWTALFAAVFVLFGLSLTASRAAWIGIVILVAATWAWRSLWSDRKVPWIITSLSLYFLVCVQSASWLSQVLSLGLPDDIGNAIRIGGQTRLAVWPIFIDAIWQHPIFGYGWNQGGLAFMTAMENHSSLNLYFPNSHNLFLDLMVWSGVPIGLFVSFFLLRWIWLALRNVRTPEDAVLVSMLLVVGNHAMLEMPLHHGYFLLPVGLVIGALNVRFRMPEIFTCRCLFIGALWIPAASLLAVIIYDYIKIEKSYIALRFEEQHIKTDIVGSPPEVILLTQLSEFIRIARIKPVSGMSSDDLNSMRDIASILPSMGIILNLATSLAMNHKPKEAHLWLARLCKNDAEASWRIAKAVWEQRSLTNAQIAAVPWPN